MTQVPASHSGRELFAPGKTKKDTPLLLGKGTLACLGIPLVMVLSALAGFGQGAPKVTSVEPTKGEINDAVTVIGENLGKGSVAGVFLSDDKNDYKSAVVNQSAEKILIKVPQVKPGDYNVSIQVGTRLYIEPVRFTVQK
jgi:IPT/TIG domain